MATGRKSKPKPLTIRLEGVHRERVEAIMQRLGIENPQDAVRMAVKAYVDSVEPPPLAASTLALIDDRIRRQLGRSRPKKKAAVAARPRLDAEALAVVRARHKANYAEHLRIGFSEKKAVPVELTEAINGDATTLRRHGELVEMAAMEGFFPRGQ